MIFRLKITSKKNIEDGLQLPTMFVYFVSYSLCFEKENERVRKREKKGAALRDCTVGLFDIVSGVRERLGLIKLEGVILFGEEFSRNFAFAKVLFYAALISGDFLDYFMFSQSNVLMLSVHLYTMTMTF